ncbi:MAG TPA: PASTA domain-containing protein [Gaiellaceae bacterium]|nr:PASTA domain-containing protein [Gaiellaceae bacterium]
MSAGSPARWRLVLFTALACLALVGVARGAASALVGTSPVKNAPYIQVNGTGTSYVRASTLIGSRVYIGGTFSEVFEPASGQNYPRHGLYSYDDKTDRVTSFAPTLNGEVWALDRSPDGRYLYAAGNFTTVDGAARTGLARFDLKSGALTKFNAHLNGQARTVDYVHGHLVVGGTFTAVNGARRVALASLDPATGALQSYLDAELSGTVSSTAGPTAVHHTAVNSTETQMAIAGNFTSAGGATHWRTFLLDLGASSATVGAWNAPILQQPCDSVGHPNYVSAMSFSQDGTWFAMVTSGYRNLNSGFPLTQTVCGAVARFSTREVANIAPAWANYTGCDSLYGVLVEPGVVYVDGHQRWLDNTGCDVAGTGAVKRPGLGAVDPTTGRALSWNPTRSRGRGADFLELIGPGLLILSDCAAPGNSGDASSGANYLAGAYHPCVGVLRASSTVKQTLTVRKLGARTGTVVSRPAGIKCGSRCSHSYTVGSSVRLIARSGKGWGFAGWSGVCTGKSACTVPLTADRSVRASFRKACVVPELEGKSLSAAGRTLKAYRCRVGKVRHAFSARLKAGLVISERPKAHSVRKPGAAVTLVVSKGAKG